MRTPWTCITKSSADLINNHGVVLNVAFRSLSAVIENKYAILPLKLYFCADRTEVGLPNFKNSAIRIILGVLFIGVTSQIESTPEAGVPCRAAASAIS